jgi:ABC-type nitrate/sulfonate/bicarbonate transport system permease component
MVKALRVAALLGLWATWELAARSGLFYSGIVPSSLTVMDALVRLLSRPDFYNNFIISAAEIGAATAIGTIAALIVGIAIGYSRYLSDAFEPLLYYLAPTPKIVFFPLLLIAFGVDAGSKIAVGALSAFFPLVMNTVAGMRQVERVHLDVGRSFNLNPMQMIGRIYIPSMRLSLLTGFRLGVGLAIIGVLLAETKLSNRGLGFMIISYYNTFRIPDLYAVLIVVFGLAALINTLLEYFEEKRPA